MWRPPGWPLRKRPRNQGMSTLWWSSVIPATGSAPKDFAALVMSDPRVNVFQSSLGRWEARLQGECMEGQALICS